MQHCNLLLGRAKRDVRLELTDFNRLRWVLAAIRSHAELRQLIERQSGAITKVLDSTLLLNADCDTPLPTGAFVVLWDGFNSLLELWQADLTLQARTDLTYLYVGHLPDLASAFPVNSFPLFGAASFDSASFLADGNVRQTWRVDLRSQLQRYLRPLKNRRESPAQHRLLESGGNMVFCGLVRPTEAVLDNFFRGTSMAMVRPSLRVLEGLEWRAAEGQVWRTIAQAYRALRLFEATGPADISCIYAVVNILHRMGTLSIVNAISRKLLVNEYGLQAHLDPYDTAAYRNNLFIDFGSTRGPDPVYPRTVDLMVNNKPHKSLRLIAVDERFVDFLKSTDEVKFEAICHQHAYELITGLEIVSSQKA